MLQIPVPYAHFDAVEISDDIPHLLSEHHRTVAPSGAPDRNRQVALPLVHVLRHEESQHVRQLLLELLRDGVPLDETDDRLVAPGERLEAWERIAVWEEPRSRH